MATVELNVSPMNRVEGDLDVHVTIDDGVVTKAETHGTMFRGFEIILKGKDPQAGLIVTPRICGICGGSHLYKSAYALDTAWATEVPPNAHLVRSIAQACETLLSIPRYFYGIFGIDLPHPNFSSSPLYEEACRRFTAFTGTSYGPGVLMSAKPAEIYAILGGQWPHSSFMIPGGVMGAPTLSDITRSIAILENWKDEWLEKQWLGCSVDRWLEIKSWNDLMAWLDESEAHQNSDCGFFLRYALDIGLDSFGGGVGNYYAAGTFFEPSKYTHPTIESRSDALITRSGIYAQGQFYDFDQSRIVEDLAHAYYKASSPAHPFQGVTEPIDPAIGKDEGKYSWVKAARYDVPGIGPIPMEVGPLARQVIAGRPGAAEYQESDPFILDVLQVKGPSVLTRQLARVHEAPKYYRLVRSWLDQIDLHGSFASTPTEHPSGQGFGATEAARGALSDWITIKDGKIDNYQVITPSGWNLGPTDSNGLLGPVEQALVGTPVKDPNAPVELGLVTRSFDACLVCAVHAYDGKTGEQLSEFIINGDV